MSEISIEPVRDSTQRREFLRLPERLYADDAHYVVPLRIERRDFFDPRKNPFFNEAAIEMFLARRDGQAVGRITAHVYPRHNEVHGEKTGFFGFFDVVDDYDIARQLWDTAAQWSAARGMSVMRGPANFTTNHEVGFLAEGFDTPPMVMMTHTPRRYCNWAERYGMTKAMDLYAYYADESWVVPERLSRLIDKIAARTKVTIRTIDMKRFDDEVTTVKRIYDAAWEDNWGFVPMSEAEFMHTAKDMKMIVDPNVVLFAEVDGDAVGFSLALPNINMALAKLKGRLLPFGWARLLWHLKLARTIDSARVVTMGILPEYRGKGIDSLLHYESEKRGRLRGYKRGEMSWVLENNVMMNRLAELLGLVRYKTYRLYDYPLAATDSG